VGVAIFVPFPWDTVYDPITAYSVLILLDKAVLSRTSRGACDIDSGHCLRQDPASKIIEKVRTGSLSTPATSGRIADIGSTIHRSQWLFAGVLVMGRMCWSHRALVFHAFFYELELDI